MYLGCHLIKRVIHIQVKNQQGHWISADPIPGTFVCNIGDMLKVPSCCCDVETNAPILLYVLLAIRQLGLHAYPTSLLYALNHGGGVSHLQQLDQ